MLRIDICRRTDSTAFILEGKLVGAWVEALRSCWSDRAADSAIPIYIDLSGVSFVDTEGRNLLAEMYRGGAKLVAAGCLTKAIVREIEREVGKIR